MNESIVGVVVTFNRLDLLKNCITSLKRQTRSLDQIIVVNNGSTDGTEKWLNEQQGLIVIHQENSGGAGGFHRGMKEGYEHNYDWIWVMDDDCVANDDCLETMLASYIPGETLSLAPVVVQRDGEVDIRHRGYFDYSIGSPTFQIAMKAENATDILVDFASFVGLMVHRSAIKEIGLPLKQFFIHNDDIEFCMRLNKISKIKLCVKAKIYHLENATAAGDQKSFLGHTRLRPPIDKLWIKYYGVRNSTWIKRKYIHSGSASAKIQLFGWIAKSLYAHLKDIIMYDDNKYKRFRFYLNAYRDGWQDKFDNEKPKKLLVIKSNNA